MSYYIQTFLPFLTNVLNIFENGIVLSFAMSDEPKTHVSVNKRILLFWRKYKNLSCRLGTGFRNMDFSPSSLSSLSRYSLSAYSSPSSCFAVFFSFCDISGLEGLFFLFSCCFAMGLLYPILAGFFDLACGCWGEMNSLKGRFSSGLEGASAIKWFGDLTGTQPCELMHNNHNQMKTELVWENSV